MGRYLSQKEDFMNSTGRRTLAFLTGLEKVTAVLRDGKKALESVAAKLD